MTTVSMDSESRTGRAGGRRAAVAAPLSVAMVAVLLVGSTLWAGPVEGDRTGRLEIQQAAGSVAEDPAVGRLQADLERIVDEFDGRIGVFVRHLESDVTAGVDPDTPYPMASTYKVPILVEVMSRVRSGDWSLDDRIALRPEDQHIGSGLLSALWAPGAELSLKNLATMMIILSDNSATDMLLDRVGADRVTARMRQLGLDGIRVDRTTLELILDYLGAPYAEVSDASLTEIESLLEEHDTDGPEAKEAAERYYRTSEDVATARDMTDLLAMIARGEATTPELDAQIVEIMKRTRTGSDRLAGMLPPGTELAHKTGTVGRVVNDVGILFLPGDLGRVAISVFTLADEAEYDDSQEAIAQLARTAYDFFRYTAAGDDEG